MILFTCIVMYGIIFFAPELCVLFVGFSVFLSNISLMQGGTLHDY
ncbi:hypothetical protein MC28_1615 [Bacillus thuringiensis MC28]|nr:hypothetical protein MC28_1615 [Bacillus thuringiensis MC28]